MGCYSSKPARSEVDQRLRGLPTPPTRPSAAAAAAAGPPPRIKLVLLGDSGVGKSCLVLRYVRGQFDPASRTTVGAAFMSHAISLPAGRGQLRVDIWDTAGQERYLSLAPLYYRGAHAAVVVYSIASAESFEKAKMWIQELHSHAGSIVMVLVGNKSDLAEEREVAEEDARAFADSQNMLFVEASAKTAAGVADVFEGVAAKLAGALPVSVGARMA